MEKENIITNVEETPISANMGSEYDKLIISLHDRNQIACYSSAFVTAALTIASIATHITQDPINQLFMLATLGCGAFSGYSLLEMNRYKEDYKRIISENDEKVKTK